MTSHNAQNLAESMPKNIRKDCLFVGYKPPFVSSNQYVQSIKKACKLSKIGYSGTLDPFAKGSLIVASGAYTRLLPHLQTSPKTYLATLWLGAQSKSLDITQIRQVERIKEYSSSRIVEVLDSLKGRISYIPPIFSAKKIQGKRAYELARCGKDVNLHENNMEVFDIECLHYCHPFLHFKAVVSKGAYVRSLGEMTAKKLGCNGTLSALERVSEGEFYFDNYKILSPLKALQYPRICLDRFCDDIRHGRKIVLRSDFSYVSKNTNYLAVFDEFFSIICIDNENQIQYILNNIPCKRD